MNCEGVRAVLAKNMSTTTVAERNAACVHCRSCEDCQRLMIDLVKEIPPEMRVRNLLAASMSLAKDRADPEWK